MRCETAIAPNQVGQISFYIPISQCLQILALDSEVTIHNFILSSLLLANNFAVIREIEKLPACEVEGRGQIWLNNGIFKFEYFQYIVRVEDQGIPSFARSMLHQSEGARLQQHPSSQKNEEEARTTRGVGQVQM